MKTPLKIIGAILTILLASFSLLNAESFATNQYISGTANLTGFSIGEFNYINPAGESSTVSGALGALNVSATIITQQEPVEKTTASSANTVTITSESKANTTRLTNANILALAGVSTKGATLGLLLTVGDGDGDEAKIFTVAVTRSGGVATLRDISGALSLEPSDLSVVVASSKREVLKNGEIVSSRETSSDWSPTPVSIGNIDLPGMTSGRLTLNIAPGKNTISAVATTSFSGVLAGVGAAPTLTGYAGMGSSNPLAFDLAIATPFVIAPDEFTTGATLSQAKWEASGLPKNGFL